MTDHTSKQFDPDLELDPLARAGRWAGWSSRRSARAIDALTSTATSRSPTQVIEADDRVNELEVAHRRATCSQIIVRRQPAAGDLRLIIAISKIVTDLERIGDEAQKIARMAKDDPRARRRRRRRRVVEVRHVGRDRRSAMLRRALDASRASTATARPK